MELSAPERKVNVHVPTIIINTQNILSIVVRGLISPYPTVATVVTIKYTLKMYRSKPSISP